MPACTYSGPSNKVSCEPKAKVRLAPRGLMPFSAPRTWRLYSNSCYGDVIKTFQAELVSPRKSWPLNPLEELNHRLNPAIVRGISSVGTI